VKSFVDVEGTPRDVHPILRDEIYRIAGEALRNAFRHAQARRIEVTIWYGERQFRLRVRDVERASTLRCSMNKGAPDTGACAACASAPNSSAGTWKSGVSRNPAHRLN
jgi:hypothetical protein